MTEDLLLMNGLSTQILERLSYESHLGKSLKYNLHHFDKEALLNELFEMAEWLSERDELLEIALDYRIKSEESIVLKYERYYPDRQVRKTFNDILGFRAFCDDYRELIGQDSDVFRVVDMSDGKSSDDGYRGVHLYYQLDNRHYPIEVQFNTLYDRQMNNWLHDYLYKKNYPDEVGRVLRERYEEGRIHSKDDFEEELNDVLRAR